MPDKNVQLPDGRIVSFPDSMNDEDIAAVIKKQQNPQTERAMQFGPGGPMFVDVPKGEKAQFEAAGRKGLTEGGKVGTEMLGAAAGGEAAAGMRGLIGVIARMAGSGAGGAIGNVVGQGVTTGKVDPIEAIKTGGSFAAGQGVGEAFSGISSGIGQLRNYLGNLIYGESGQLTPLAKAIVHPTELTEMALRKAVPNPNAAAVEEAAILAKAGKPVPITKSPAFDPAAYRAGAATRATPKINTTPFPGATSSSTSEADQLFQKNFGKEYKEAGDLAEWETGSREGNLGAQQAAGWQTSAPTNLSGLGQPQMVSKFKAPEPSKILSPESPPPHVEGSYWSFEQKELLRAAIKDRAAAIVYKQRFGSLPENYKYLTDVDTFANRGEYKSRNR